ncbi:ExeM/NucH family extracellular endonuclease [Chamaesiphon sp. OTE_20_metabat_361]|uniref:ExeM/NucH family extracellular endonuclease n=1 Tax=Chamaesiphon sp. OTE_20_metabat_361 TaxID=2964689 RepID=UPI00286B8153|nr:ExeM/NucH family extracellular endonuclease [Chamaesiphon sp. OTE_20_metabat_361]
MALNPGDIAFVQYNADNTDNFAFVTLVTIPAGEVILFTDNGWLNTNAFRTGEGIITWTAPAGGVTAGTVVTIDTTPTATAGAVVETGDLNFAAAGDQIIAFQGSLASPTAIAALNNDGSSVFQTTASDTNTSALPQGLVIGTSAVAIAEIDNARYTGTTTGDRATLQAALYNPANWAGDDATNQTFAGAFTIGGGSTPTVSISATANAAEADTANGSFRISRTGETTNALDVNYAVDAGTGQATPGTDYTALAGIVTIAAGSSFVDVIVAPVDDALVEGNETVTLTLSPSASFTLGTATDSVTIVDNDSVAPSTTKVSTIQGTGTAATAGVFTIEGIVVGDFQATGQLGGFYLQEENTDADGNPLTSEGIFVNSLTAVDVGDKVRVTGTVAENATAPSFNQATITPTTAADISVLATGQQVLVTPTVLDLPIATLGDLERFEGMLITVPETLTVTEVFNLGRFGEVSLSADGRLFNPTNIIDPNDAIASGTNSTGTSNVAAVTAQQDLNNRRRILLDDGSSLSNLSDVPYIDTTDANPANDTLRIGSTIGGLTGVLGFGFNSYRIQPPQAPVFDYEPRPALPNVGGGIKVGSFNVLNYFNGDGLGGGFPTSRGATTAIEFSRQRDKIISAIKDLNADVVGLIEMENDGDGTNSAIANLVNGLNASIGSNTYDYIKLANTTGSPGTDEIKVAFIYKPGAVTPVGNAVYFNDSAFNTARPPLAQTFSNNASGEKFTPIVNHFKSKGSSAGLPGDTDQGDGQGLSNATRKAQSTALLNFVAQVQTASGDSDVMVLGDLNAYNEEDPIDILRAGGLTKLATTTDSYVFDGQTGSLDHALVTSSLLAQVTGAAKWNINSSEPIVLDYNDDVLSSGENPAEDRNDTSLYAPDRFRSSDHDPVLAGLDLKPTGGNPLADNLISTSGSDTLFGGAGNDIINGGAGNDFITGGAGVDSLFGGTGADTFVFYGSNEGIDKINDFEVGIDRLSISRSGFGVNNTFGSDALGVLDATRFGVGASAATASQRFVYNNNSGALFFDADGSGGAAQVRIAQFVGNPALTNTSFVVA